MTWIYQPDGTYQRPCSTCHGKGHETLDKRFSGGNCNCPWENCEDLDHPSNTANHPDDKYKGVWHKVTRCNKCGLFWLVYFEYGDDSLDIPGPECLGKYLPEDTWTPK